MNKVNDLYTIGIDFGTDSVRALVVHTGDGSVIAKGICEYPRWAKGMYCDASHNQFRQHPQDHITAMSEVVSTCVQQVPQSVRLAIKGITVDTTGSSPGFVNKYCESLAQTEKFKDNPDAMFMLWKDHCAVKEASEINHHAVNYEEHIGIDYLRYVGGVYSAEWFWAKIMFLLRENASFSSDEFTVMEHVDWVTANLIGCNDITQVKRSRCAAGHKALWHEQFNGYPPLDFFSAIELSVTSVYSSIQNATYTTDMQAGILSDKWADLFGISHGVIVGVGALDAHMGAIGAGIRPYDFVRVMGTSTCDIITVPYQDIGDEVVQSICGQVDGSVVPGMIGFEAGQSSFGDVFAWFKRLCTWNTPTQDTQDDTFFARIEEATLKETNAGDARVLALDWLNGRRTPYANQLLCGAVLGLTLGTDAPTLYRAFIESVAMGSRTIVQSFESQGITLNNIIAIGSVAKKSPLIMQILANVLQREVHIIESDQSCALGAAICAATASGIYNTIPEAMECMSSKIEHVFTPNQKLKSLYDALYREYTAFGGFIENFHERNSIKD